MRRGGAPSVSCRTHGHHRSAHHPRLAMQIRRCDQEYATGTFSLSFKQKVAHEAVVAHVLATFQRMFWTKISACFGCVLARVSDAKVRMLCLPRSGVTSSQQLDPTGGNAGRAPTLPPLGLTRARKGPRYAKRPLSPVGTSPCCQALVRRRSSSGPARGARSESSGTVPAWLPALTMRLEPSTKTTDGFTVRTRDSGTWRRP